MAESKRRPRKLKGAVLIMVVTLLFVLVVMLLATLTVVSNANRRTITKYEENQAYYTARSALEVYINEMLEDQAKISDDASFSTDGDDVKSAWEDITPVGSSSQVFVFDTPDADTMATNLSSDKDFTGNDITKGFIHQQEIFCYLTPKYVVDPSKYEDSTGAPNFLDPKSENVWKKTSEVASTGYSENDSYIEYVAVLPKTSINGNELGKLADDSNSDNYGEVHIKVELLRMLYKDSDGNILYDGSYVSQNSNNLDGSCVKMSAIDWNETYYRLKVTATTSVSDSTGGLNESTVSVLLEPNTQVSPASFTNAMTSFEGTAQSAKGFVIGGASASSPGDIYYIQNDSALFGSYVYDYAQVTSNSKIEWQLPENGYYVVRNGYISLNNDTIVSGYGSNTANGAERDARPYVYSAGFVGGSGNSLQIGESNASCDLITVGNRALGATVNYDSNLTQTDKENIAFITHSNNTNVYGDIYCDGDIYLRGNVRFYGDVYCTGNIYYSGGSTTFSGGSLHLVSGKGVLIPDGGEYVPDTSGSISYSTDCTIVPGSLKVDPLNTALELEVDSDADDGELEYAVTLPLLPERTSKITIDSAKSETENYRVENSDGTYGDPKSAKQMFAESCKIDEATASLSVDSAAPVIRSSSQMVTNGCEFTYETEDGTALSSYSCYTKFNGKVIKNTYVDDNGFAQFKLDFGTNAMMNCSEVFYIDATKKNVQIEMTGCNNPTSIRPTFIVLGSNSVVFTVADSASPNTVAFGSVKIMTEEIANIFPGTASNRLEFGDEGYFEKLRQDTSDPNNATKPNNPSPPKIYYYFGANSVINPQGCNEMLLCGYMYGPKAEFNCQTPSNIEYYFTYNGVEGKQKISVIGSIVFKNIDTCNDFGIAFTPPGGGGDDSMIGTMITWDKQRYLGS